MVIVESKLKERGRLLKPFWKITDFGIYNFYYQFQQFNIFSLAVPNTIFWVSNLPWFNFQVAQPNKYFKYTLIYRILLFLKYRSIINFWRWRRWGGGLTKLVTFGGRHKCMSPELRIINISILCNLTNSIFTNSIIVVRM